MRSKQTYIVYVYVYGAALGLLGGQKIRKPKKFLLFLYVVLRSCRRSFNSRYFQVVRSSSCTLEVVVGSNTTRKLYLFAQPWGPLRRLQLLRGVGRQASHIFTILTQNDRAGSRAVRLKLHKHTGYIVVYIYIVDNTRLYRRKNTTTDAINIRVVHTYIYLNNSFFFRFFFYHSFCI